MGLLIFALLGGWISRMCGGAPPKLPFGLDQWLYALPYGALIAYALHLAFPHSATIIISGTLGLYLLTVMAKRTGHGGGMDLGHSTVARKDEALEFLIKRWRGRISEYAYDFLLLAITGLAVTLPSAIALIFISPACALLMIYSGVCKSISYVIGWRIYPHGEGKGLPHLREATAIGEFVSGYFGYLFLFAIFMHLSTTH